MSAKICLFQRLQGKRLAYASSFWGPPHSFACDRTTPVFKVTPSSLSLLHLHMEFSSTGMCQSSPGPPPIRKPVTAFRTYPHSPRERPHLKILNFTSLLPYEVTLTGPRELGHGYRLSECQFPTYYIKSRVILPESQRRVLVVPELSMQDSGGVPHRGQHGLSVNPEAAGSLATMKSAHI